MPVPVSAMELLKSQAGRFIVAVVFLLGMGLKCLVLAFPPLAQALRLVPLADTLML